MRTAKTKNLILCGLFTSLIVVGAFIRIPIPVVPFTLQLLFTMLAGLLLGGKWGAASVCIYIVLGLMGLPVFAEGGGLAYVPVSYTHLDVYKRQFKCWRYFRWYLLSL